MARGRPCAGRAGRGPTGAWLAGVADRAGGCGDREEPVAILLPQGPELIAAILGALAAGKIYVPLDPAHSPFRNRDALADCSPALLLGRPGELTAARDFLTDDRLLDLAAIDERAPSEDPSSTRAKQHSSRHTPFLSRRAGRLLARAAVGPAGSRGGARLLTGQAAGSGRHRRRRRARIPGSISHPTGWPTSTTPRARPAGPRAWPTATATCCTTSCATPTA